MADIEKIMNISTDDIEKIMNIATGDIETVMGHEIPSAGWTGTRGVLAGGHKSASGDWSDLYINEIDYKSIASTGAMSDFGNLSAVKASMTGTSNGSRGVFMGGNKENGGTIFYNVIEYITVGSTGDVTDAGDLIEGRVAQVSASNGTRALTIAGSNSAYAKVAAIDYFTIASTENASDFGDVTTGAVFAQGGAMNDATYALRYHGGTAAAFWTNKYIDYVSMATTSDTSDFGDMTATGARGLGGCSSETRGITWSGQSESGVETNVIAYVTLASLGDATDFGDMNAFGGTGGAHNDASGNNAVSNLTKGEVYGGTISYSPGYARQTIEYVTIASTGNATDAGDDLTAEKTVIASLSGT